MVRRIRRKLLFALLLLLGLGLIVSALADRLVERHENGPLAQHDPRGGFRFDVDDCSAGTPGGAVENSNGLFVCLSLSGGGTRAAALAYGVLAGLRDLEIQWPAGSGRRVSLLDEVDVISSVSGGSFAAAYYGLFGQRLFEDFEQRFLKRDFQAALLAETLSPANLFRQASGRFDRIDLAAELYGREIFEDRTFADLRSARRRPFVVLNATNVTFGSQFSFTQDFFDFLGSDLDTFPVGRAVAASSAFPFLLSPVTLRNHPAPAGFELPVWARTGLEHAGQNPRLNAIARTLAPYHEDKAGHPYLHLLDGGLSDNLGLRYLVRAYQREQIRELLQRSPQVDGRPVGRIERLLFIVVNARTDPPQELDRRASAPGAAEVAQKTATVSMENYTFETVELARELLYYREQQARTLQQINLLMADDPDHRPLPELTQVRMELVELSLQDLVDPQQRAELLELPTSFKLEPDQVEALIAAGRGLLEQHAALSRFLADLR